jgi:hypothetical protein
MATEANFDAGTIKETQGVLVLWGSRNSNSAKSVICGQFHFYMSPFFFGYTISFSPNS